MNAYYRQLCRGLIFLTLCGVIGWCYETILTSILWGRFCGFFARGMLHVPVCPIYGFFALLLLGLFRLPPLQRLRGVPYAAAIFLLGTVVSTILELLASYLLEWTLGLTLWDYTAWEFHFQGRISLYSSLLFGVLSLVLFLGVVPLFQRIQRRLGETGVAILGTGCGVVLLTDLIITLI